ncbi:ABC transporter [Microbacterium sp.]|uniref:ABC transporter n=1 Tax=Microbacterium sp. TaxID=51671 RepID=UPI003A952947
MSDPQEPVGAPVEEPTPDGDVVSRAHEGLADAEAAGRTAEGAAPATSADAGAAAPDAAPDSTAHDSAAADSGAPDSAAADSAASDAAAADSAAAADESADTADDEPAFSTPGLNEAYAADAAAASGTAALGPAETPSSADTAGAYAADAPTEAAAAAAASTTPAFNQPIFVQAPEEPRPRGNRAAAGGIGLIAAVCFAALYLAADLVINLVDGKVSGDTGGWLVDQLGTWGLWVPTAVFFLAFWLLGAIINRGRWGVWVIFGLLVGLAAYGGHIAGQLFEAPFWNITASEGAQIAHDQLFAPLAIAAFVIARELTIWFSAWVAARGKRMNELNVEARREYERTIEAGPQLAR